jgi:hypothetical protein
VHPGGVDGTLDSTPHILVTHDGSGSTALQIRWWIHNRYNGQEESLQSYYQNFTVTAGGSKIIALPCTFEQIATWQAYMNNTLTPTVPFEVRFTYNSANAETITYNLYGSEFKKWVDQRGYPRFDQEGTYLERASTTSGGGYTSDDEGPHLRAYMRHIKPAHFPFSTRVMVTIKQKNGGSVSTLVNWAERDLVNRITSGLDNSQEYTSSGSLIPEHNLAGVVKVIYELQWCAADNFTTTIQTVDTMTLYISYLPPLMEWNTSGNGVSFGMFPSGTPKRLEVASDWVVDVLGSLNSAQIGADLKALIQDAVYPVGTMIWALSAQDLATLESKFPSNWIWIDGEYFVVPYGNYSGVTANVYFAKRTQ